MAFGRAGKRPHCRRRTASVPWPILGLPPQPPWGPPLPMAPACGCTCLQLHLSAAPEWVIGLRSIDLICLYICLQRPLENHNLLLPLFSLPYLAQQAHWLTPTQSHARAGFLTLWCRGGTTEIQGSSSPLSRDRALSSLPAACPQKPECGCMGGDLCWPGPRSSSCSFTSASPNSGSRFLSFLAVLEGIHALTLPLSFQSLPLPGVSFNVTLVEIPDPKPGQAPLFAPAGLYFCFLACITPVIKCLSV